jgi:hypothetical protein
MSSYQVAVADVGVGGETPINNSIILYESLKAKHPEFIRELREKVLDS